MFTKVVPFGLDDATAVNAVSKIRLRDVSILVIGQGPVAEKLVQRRRAAGGRVCWLWTEEPPQEFVEPSPPPQRTCAGRDAEPTWDMATFAWKPPQKQCRGDRAFVRLQRHFGTTLLDWRTSGPLLVRLQAGEAYRILHGGDGESSGIQVFGTEHPDMAIRWEISGIVIFAGLDPGLGAAGLQACLDEASAVQTDMDVLYEEARPVATINPSHVAFWAPVYFIQYLGFYLLMATQEPGMRLGSIPWWRGSFTALIIMPVGFSAFPDFMGVALTGLPVSSLTARFAAAAIYLVGQVASAIMPLGRHGGEWFALPIFMAVSVAFLPYFLVAALLHVLLTRSARALRLGHRRLPWCSHVIWLVWIIFGTFGTWLVLYGVALFFIAASKWSDLLASFALPILTWVVELGTVAGTVLLYKRLVYLPRARAAEMGGNRPFMLGDQRELIILPISITHAYAEATRLVSLLASAVFNPSWIWVPQLLVCCSLNVLVRSTLMTELLSRALPAKWWYLIAPDAGTILHNEVKLCFGYPRFIALAALAVANLILHGWSCWPLFNMHATIIVPCAFMLEVLEDVIVTGRLASAMTWRCRMATFYRGEPPLGVSQVMGFDRDGVQWSGPAIGFSGMRFVRFRLVVVAMAASSFFPYTLLTLLLGAGFVHGVCASPISEGYRIIDGLIWHLQLRC